MKLGRHRAPGLRCGRSGSSCSRSTRFSRKRGFAGHRDLPEASGRPVPVPSRTIRARRGPSDVFASGKGSGKSRRRPISGPPQRQEIPQSHIVGDRPQEPIQEPGASGSSKASSLPFGDPRSLLDGEDLPASARLSIPDRNARNRRSGAESRSIDETSSSRTGGPPRLTREPCTSAEANRLGRPRRPGWAEPERPG